MNLIGIINFRKSWLVIIFSILFYQSIAQIQPVRTEPAKGTKYLEHLPADYSTSGKSYPLLIWLHGTGERGTNIDQVRYFGISKHIENGHNMTFKAGGTGPESSFIVMSPQLPSGSWNSPIVKELINHAINTYRVDETRIYVVGLSLGGNGVWDFIMNPNHNNPNRVAAIVPIAAWGSDWLLCDLGTPTYAVWGFHGENDNTILLVRGQKMIDAYNNCSPAPAQPALFTIYPGVGHNAWDNAFRTDHSLHNPNMYEWLLLQSLGGNPSANAGADQTITLPTNTTSFIGSGSDPDGTIASYLWTKLTGPSATLVNATSSTLTVNGLVEGTYEFQLQVTDNDGNVATDQVSLTVLPAVVNQPPVANAGPDKTITLPTNSLNLSGSGTDSDGSIATYLWTKQSGPAATLTNTGLATLSLSNLVEGSYVFRLTVTDDDGATNYDEVNVTVNPVSTNQSPSVNTGSDQTVNLPTNTINLTGVASDPDGTIVTYAWTKVSGPTSTFVNADKATVTVNNLVAGTYVFQLMVTDNGGATASDAVQVTVVAANVPPTSNAGVDKSLTLPTNQINIAGSGTDSDGSIISYLWSKTSGPTATLTNTTQATLTAADLLEGTYVFRLLVTDDDGATAFDEMTLTVSSAPLNQNPVANAGPDISFSLPQSGVTINGSATDADGVIVKYVWSKISGPSATLSGDQTSQLVVSNMVEGNYVFQLLVRDEDGAPGTDQVAVTVFPASVNQTPIVDAGPDKSLILPTNSTSIAATVTDDGTITSYAWTKESGPSATLSGAATQTLNLSNLVEGSYTFKLTVVDDGGASGSDEVKVDVTSANLPPTVDVGADMVVTTTSTPFSVIATSSDPDGTIVNTLWTQQSGPSATFSQSTNQLNLISLVQGIYIFRLTVTDDLGATAFDEIKITVNAAASNQQPTVDAGADQIINLPTNSTNISGTASDSDGTIATYSWAKISGPAGITLQNQTTATLTVTNLSAGVFTFRLTVTDNEGATNFDDVIVTVNSVNQAPVANAGPNKTITLPLNSLVLMGSGTDADGTIASYLWTKINGPSVTMSNTSTPNLSLSNLLEGSYSFRLTVSDDDGATGTSDVSVTVQPEIVNQPPTSSAGADQSIQLPTNSISLFGSGSDTDGSVVSYLWSQISGPTATLSNTTSPTLGVSNMLEGVYLFELVVTDDDGATASDDIQVTVLNSSVNLAPVANAGSDLSINLPTNSTNVNGSGSDSDGTIQSYLWEQLSGPSSATFVNETTSTLTISDCVEGIYTLRLTVTDDDGDSDSDEMTLTVVAESTNKAPTVNAGLDITIQLPKDSTTITSSASDTDGTIAAFLWSKISGPSATLTNQDKAELKVNDMLEGQYVFRITVTDDDGAVGSDDVKVTVLNQSANLAPSADAGFDQTISLPNQTITLTGTGQDQDGTIVSYLWEKVVGPSVTIVDETAANVDLEDLLEGQYTFQLTVTDDDGATGTDQAKVTVLPESVNQDPTADAGGDRTVSVSSGSFVVNGGGSDPEGGDLTYEWEVLGMPGGSVGNLQTKDLVVSNIQLGNYSFKLTVTDDKGASAFDFSDVKVVAEDLVNPVADAGEDKTVDVVESSALIVGTGTDADGIVVGYHWRQTSGTPVTLEFSDTDSLTITNLSVGSLEFELEVTDNDGLSAVDKVTIVVTDGETSPGESFPVSKVFTPNGDGINDYWILTEDTQSISECSLTIYDKFGQKVYEANPYQNDWDGVYNGKTLREDAYYYVLNCADGSSKSGGIRIIR
ncbi:MAG: tandem-95 repeat protein [Cyclobacteriaceae bacterium]|nr:tandem-95 repeat protein [Cyclobacteriaceae bacterium]